MYPAEVLYQFSPVKAKMYHKYRDIGHGHSVAEEISDELSDDHYRRKSQETISSLTDEQVHGSGFSRSQISSFMTVLECDADTAKKLLAVIDDGSFDWSEATWEEIYLFALSAKITAEQNETP